MTRIKKDLIKKNSQVDLAIVESLEVLESDSETNSALPEADQIDKKDDKSIDRSMYFFNRELSWVAFNKRVLNEGIDPRTPLLERAKFFAIFSTNLDEFFMVRVARVKKKFSEQFDIVSDDGLSPDKQLKVIRNALVPLVRCNMTSLRIHFAQNCISIK